MSDRITKANVETRCANLNRRGEREGSFYRYEISYRNGYCAIDRVSPDGNVTYSTVRVGTYRLKGEIEKLKDALRLYTDAAVSAGEDANELQGELERIGERHDHGEGIKP